MYASENSAVNGRLTRMVMRTTTGNEDDGPRETKAMASCGRWIASTFSITATEFKDRKDQDLGMGLGEHAFGGVITDFIVARAKKPEEGTDGNEERQASEGSGGGKRHANLKEEQSLPVSFVVRRPRPLILAILFFLTFLGVELSVAREPVMGFAMLRQKIPVPVRLQFLGVSVQLLRVLFLSDVVPVHMRRAPPDAEPCYDVHGRRVCDLDDATHWTLQEHQSNIWDLPFRWRRIISLMHKDSETIQSWFSIIPLGFGNAVVLQTMMIALFANLPESRMAVGTGFGQLSQGIGQVGGVAFSSVIFNISLHRRMPSLATVDNENPPLQRDRSPTGAGTAARRAGLIRYRAESSYSRTPLKKIAKSRRTVGMTVTLEALGHSVHRESQQ
ncbi:hypothetical protein B0H13DRAFT_1902445 [Mycena leptocephala]|nr:hypothetical protein B0H13DRAFT_1902445 [Mycena leptocephala]